MGVNLPRGNERAEFLRRRRDLKMARSAHAFVRGNTRRFYDWLDGLSCGSLPEGPSVWICGDCHVGNLGPVADANGGIDIQIRDLDQTVVGNPVHDLIRLGLSLSTAARNSNLPGIVTAQMLERMVGGYAAGISSTEDDREEPRSDIVRTIRRRAIGRRWKHLLRERLGGTDPAIPLGRRFFAIDEEERAAIGGLLDEDALRRLALAPSDAGEAKIRFLDAAYWLKGCSSLGYLRYAALLGVKAADGERSLALVDIKEAVKALAPASPGATMPKDHALRVVTGARALSPNLGERMVPARLLGRPVVARELLPQDLKLDVEQFTRKEAVEAASYLAQVVGRSHGRQMDGATRTAWRREVTRANAADGGAPSWLWKSVVELAGLHETGYLRHCRTYADAA